MRFKSGLILFIISALIFLVEFFLKNYLRDNFLFKSFPLLDKIIYITVIPNTGAAFGILKNNSNLLIYLGLIFILIFFKVIFREKRKNLIFIVASGLILGGALSNIYDRIFFGYVLDYIDLRIWPVFNISDSCISIGVILLLFDSFRKKDEARDCS